ncbi:MAG: zf-HC2 domain-containing protein [Planctomycetota bacterium]|nr:zf-HC2 domain-containing protein [Planctomycetota bacterium]
MKRSMDCTDIKVLLSGLIDDELGAETRHLAERHIAECRACRVLVDEAEAAHQLVASEAQATVEPGRLPEGFVGSVLSRTVYDEPRRRGQAGSWVNWLGWMAAAACLVLAVAIWALDRRPLTGRLAPGPAPVAKAPPPAAPNPGMIQTAVYNTTGRSWTFDGELPPDALALPGAGEADSHAAIEDDAGSTATRLAGAGRNAADSAAAMIPLESGAVTEDGARSDSPAAPPISRRDAETLDAAALLLEWLLAGDDDSFADIESIRRVAEYDGLPTRLAEARDRLAPADRPAVFAAESILWRIVHGPLSLDDVRDLRRTVSESDLAAKLEVMSGRRESAGAL